MVGDIRTIPHLYHKRPVYWRNRQSEQWEVHCLGFARAGWTDASHAFIQELDASQPPGKNWRVAGMQLLDLAQVGYDLAARVG